MPLHKTNSAFKDFLQTKQVLLCTGINKLDLQPHLALGVSTLAHTLDLSKLF